MLKEYMQELGFWKIFLMMIGAAAVNVVFLILLWLIP